MGYAVDIDINAENDIKDIYYYISNTLANPLAAIRITDAIASEINSLSFMPHRYGVLQREPWASRQIHSVSVENYLIVYDIDDVNHVVNILRVFYGRRNI